MRVRSLAREDPLEEGVATHSSTLAWRIPMDRGAWQATVYGVTKSQSRLKQISTHAGCMYRQRLGPLVRILVLLQDINRLLLETSGACACMSDILSSV